MLTITIETPQGKFVGEIRKNKIAREILNETSRQFYYWNIEKVQRYAAKHGWRISLRSE